MLPLPSSPATRERSAPASTGLGPPSAARRKRRAQLVADFRKARLTGIRVKALAEALAGKAGEPAQGGVGFFGTGSRCGSQREEKAVGRLYAPAPGVRERLRAVRGDRRWQRVVGGEVSE